MLDPYKRLKQQYADKLPFVIYSKPNSGRIVTVFQENDALNEIKDFSEEGFAFVSYDGSKKYYLSAKTSSVSVFEEQKEEFNYVQEVARFNAEDKYDFEKLVQNGIDAIIKNEFEKVVLSRQEQIEYNDFDIVLIFKKMLHLYPSAFKYCLYHPKIGLWIGATPEQFIKVKNDCLSTVSLAGTQLFSKNVVWETKEKDEQLYVTEFIIDNLKTFSNEITASAPYTFRAGNICHIKTDISATLKNKQDLGLIINKLHPTPAVCGFPKANANRFISENEGYNRAFYSGFLGELNIDFGTGENATSNLFVNLRCMQVNEDFVTVYIGCGITKESLPEKEFVETVNKSTTIKKVL